MGCTQSKIDNEEAVTRCKDRKLYMKDAVSARNAFAAAFSAYAMSLKNAGAALSDYSHGEVLSPHHTLTHSASAPSSSSAPIPDALPPPPPPLPNFAPSPLQRAASMPEFSVHKPDQIRSDPIIEEEEDEEEVETDTSHDLKHRSSSRRGSRSGKEAEELAAPPPPSPPPAVRQAPPPPPPEAKGMSSWDFFFPSMENVPGSNLAEVDEERMERQEMERKMYEERSRKAKEVAESVDEEPKRNVMAEAAAVAVAAAEVDDESVAELPPQPPPVNKVPKKVKVAPTESKRGGKPPSSISLVQIFTVLDDSFLKASESAQEVLKMLEANRLHYHSNFADNRGHIDHSARVMRVITWNRSFRGLPNADDGLDDFDSEEHETHATVLDKMLAWEKKLYDEVKTGEQMKLDYQRKVASLNKRKKHGTNTEGIEKAKAAVSHLHTRYIVDMQSMDSTVSEINRLRDEQLYPKLIALVDGMAAMWETMRFHHEAQSKAVTTLLKYVDISHSSKETTEHHHARTNELLTVVDGWHSFFQKLISHQKEYIKALNSWLKLNLIPIDNNLKEKVSSPQRPQNPPILALLHAWHDYLDKVPDELASTAISNFSAVIGTILQYQQDELKLKFKCDETQKELARKRRQFEDWYNKYMQKRSPADDMDPDRAHEAEHIAERQLVVEIVKKKLEEDEEAYQRQCIQVREKSLASLKTQLPELFRALLVFSKSSSDMYRKLQAVSQQ